MKGYKENNNWHFIFQGLETQQLICMITEGCRFYKKMRDQNPNDKTWIEAFNESKSFRRKLGVIILGNHYRPKEANKDNPIVIEDKYSDEGV